jgi:carbamoyltransferase
MDMNILGISCFYHDSAAALVRDGVLKAAALEERFTGVKHDSEFPLEAIRFCLARENLGIEDIDYVVFYDKPFTKFDRILTSYLQTAPRSFQAFRKAIPVWLRQKLWTPQIVRRQLGYRGSIFFVEHHLSHAAGAFYSSPFESSAVVTVDGVGEWATASIGKGAGNKVSLYKVMNYPHSVGLLYSAFTYFLGFQVNSAEYKVMGLAPFGSPRYAELIKNEIVTVYDDGSIHLNLKYFDYHHGLQMTGKNFERLFRKSRRIPDTEITDQDRDLAASIQAVTEEIMLKIATHARDMTGERNLCLSGGVALNCAAAGRLLKAGLFDDIYIQPASSDGGGSVGAALYVCFSLTDHTRIRPQPYLTLGPSYSEDEIKEFLKASGIPHSRMTKNTLSEFAARQISYGKIVALFSGCMEFGPRALGFRSILADPRDPNMKSKINRVVKFREPFRPFAPAVLLERAADYFQNVGFSPYMLFNFEVIPDRRPFIPAVTHIDGSARIQTVTKDTSPLLNMILVEFEKISGVPVLLNTSFNLRGRPIVRTPHDAFSTFISSGIDVLIMEEFVIEKSKLDTERFGKFKIPSGVD